MARCVMSFPLVPPLKLLATVIGRRFWSKGSRPRSFERVLVRRAAVFARSITLRHCASLN